MNNFVQCQFCCAAEKISEQAEAAILHAIDHLLSELASTACGIPDMSEETETELYNIRNAVYNAAQSRKAEAIDTDPLLE